MRGCWKQSFSLAVTLLACILFTKANGPLESFGQDQLTAEEAREKQIIERFVTVLERNPRRGTALDRIYGHHVEWGTLDDFVDAYRQRAENDPKDGTAWMVIGLVESQRGQDAAAVEAFTRAEQLLPEDPLASYYLGQSLVMIGQPDGAVEAFERAIERKPSRPDLLEIFQALGRVHQRAQRTEQALEVWARLEDLFPDDPRVQEEIAITLTEEGQYEAALPRYESLIELTQDPYRRSSFQMEAASLKVHLKRSAEGIADFEEMLAGLNPDSWLYREVRRKIEGVFLRTDDQDGLARYYEDWLEKRPRDVDAMARLARVLARQGRVPEAQQWLEKALQLAPSRKELRLAFISQLIEQQRLSDAIKQYEQLDKNDPGNPDYLRDWGKLILRDTSVPKAERQAAAEKVWRQLTHARPDDPLIATQVADLLRHADLTEAALEHYQRAVELAPNQPQYREYLGEYYHLLERPEEALATWRAIAAGDNRTAENVARLAEVLAGFGYVDQALQEISAACALAPKDFSFQMQAAQMHLQADKLDEAHGFLAAADKLAASPEESKAVLDERIKLYQLEGTLAERTHTLAEQLEQAPSPTAEQYNKLAQYHEALRQFPEAIQAIERALELAPQSIPSLATSARIQERAGNLEEAADTNRALARIDRRYRTDYLTNVARLESQLGRTSEALDAGRALITSAPGNTENYEFFAELCFRLGEQEEGLEALRRALRVNPTEPRLAMTLGSALSDQFRTEEAIALYWRAFDRSNELADKLSVIQKQAELYLQTNRFDRLIERLERERQSDDQRRVMTICLAQAYHSAGDFGEARQELESLLSEDTRDTQLLQQLSKLSEEEGDVESALKYQEQLARLAPGRETEYRLARLYQANGRGTEATAIFRRLTAREDDLTKLLRNIDSLIDSRKYETAASILKTKLRDDPDNWELRYREGVTLAAMKSDQAARSFEALLALDTDDGELSEAERERRKRAARQQVMNRATNRQSSPYAASADPPEISRYTIYQSTHEVRRAIGLGDYYDPFSQQQQQHWVPISFGHARMAALGWLVKLSKGDDDQFLVQYRERARSENASERAIWDWLYLSQLGYDTQSRADVYKVAKRLAETGDPEAKFLFLSTVPQRAADSYGRIPSQNSRTDTVPPLPDDELELVLKCYHDITERGTKDAILRRYRNSSYLFNIVSTELKRAKREDDERELYEALIEQAKRSKEYSGLVNLAASREDWDTTFELLDRWADAAKTSDKHQTIPAHELTQLMGKFGADKKHEEVLRVMDAYLDLQIVALNRARERQRQRSHRQNVSSGSPYIQTWYGTQQNHMQLGFPQANEYLDQGSIQVLYNACNTFKRNDVLSDLVRHLEQRRDEALSADQLYADYHLCAVHWWNDEKGPAVEYFTAVSEALPSDWEMRLGVVNAYIEREDYGKALELIETITAKDHNALRERETMALGLAVRLGDNERAKQAAERLFGLRLGADQQLALAAQMRQLGMNEHADAVMARAGRQAGNRMTALVTLMNQYLVRGNGDVAIQIAHRILRRTSGSAGQIQSRNQNAAARQAALQCLAQTGNLHDLIERAEEQLQNSPKAAMLYQKLAELYEASGKREEALELQGKIVELQPDDSMLRYQYGQQLEQAGKYEEACEQYKLALVAEPRILHREYHRIFQAFRNAKKTEELVDVFDQIDMKAIRNYWYVMNIVQNLIRDEDSRELGMQLFRKAWKAFPNDRASMLGYVGSNEDLWKLPELYEMAREAFVPSEGAIQRDPWVGLHANSYSSNGMINGPLTYLLRGLGKSERLQQLRDEVAAVVEEQPDWHGGKATLVIFDLKLGKVDDSHAMLASLVEDEEIAKTMQSDTRRVIAQELEEHKELQEIAIKLYEDSLTDNPRGLHEFQYTAKPRLARMYQETHRREKARAILLEAAKEPPSRGYDPEYAAYQKVQNLSQLARQMSELEFPVDALRMYRETLVTADSPQARASRYRSSIDSYVRRARDEMQSAVEKVSAEQLASAVNELLAPPIGRESDVALDLMLTVGSDPTANPAMESLLFRFLNNDNLLTGKVQAAVDARLTELANQHPQDLSVRVARVGFSQQLGREAPAELQDLVELLKQTPLDPLEEDQRPNARQRQQSEEQLAVWLVAAECLKDAEQREVGELLARRALDAARRQLDDRHAIAMLQHWGNLAMEVDRDRASRLWSEALELALQRPPVTPQGSHPPVTQSQFRTALTLAKATAEKLPGLSLRAVRQSLEGGPPITDQLPGGLTNQPRSPFSSGSNAGDDMTRFMGEVASQLKEIVSIWQRSELPPDEVYEVLSTIVFCEARPGEILLYHRPVSQSGNAAPISIGLLLVESAVRAKRTGDLKKQIASRQANLTSQISGHVLLAQMGMATGSGILVREQLQALTQHLEVQPIATNVDIACHAAIPALEKSESLFEAALPIVDIATKTLELQSNSGIENLALKVARVHLKSGRDDEAQPHIERYLQNRMRQYARYSGDYGLYIQKRDLASMAMEASRYHLMDLALEHLGRTADTPRTSRGDADVTVAVWHLARYVSQLPVGERYRLLRDWTMPTEGRHSVRLVAAFNPGHSIPDVAVRSALRRLGEGVSHEIPQWMENDFGAISNLTLLVEAAQDAGKLDELTQLASAADNSEMIGARTLHLLCRIAAGDRQAGEPLVQAAMEEIRQRQQREQGRDWEQRPLFRDYLVMQACLRSPEFLEPGRELGRQMLQFARSNRGGDPFITHVGYEMAMADLRLAPPQERAEAAGTGLKLWFPGTPSKFAGPHTPPALWSAHEGQVVHRTGPEHDFLYFRYPLTGEFEFTFDVYCHDYATGEIGYGGLVAEPMPWVNRSDIWPISRHETLNLPRAVEAWKGFSRRMTVRVSPEGTRFLVNGHLLYEEKEPSPTSPWLHLVCLNHRQTAFRNAKFSGEPKIPRSVSLSRGNRLEGWSGTVFSSRLPRRFATEPEENLRSFGGPSPGSGSGSEDLPPEDWWAEEGEVHGRFNGQLSNTKSQALLSYLRPLQSGDAIRYEFFYEPGKVHVHPSVGEIAFLLEPNGVRFHWMTRPASTLEVYNIWEMNRLVEPECRRGSDPLPLKANEWNQAQVTLAGDTVRIRLNDQLVYERPLEPTNSRRFGLFHFRQRTAARARNIVLTGDWPESLTAGELDDPFQLEDESAVAGVQAARHALVGEPFLTMYPYEVWLAARGLPVEQRYEMLRTWVLPGTTHPGFRPQAAFRPPSPMQSTVSSREHSAGRLVAPVRELVKAAHELGKLEELAGQIDQAGAKTLHDERSQALLRLLIAIAREDDKASREALQHVFALVKEVPKGTPDYLRWPEAVAVAATVERDALLDLALELSEWIVEHQQNDYVNLSWEKTVRHLRSVAHWRQERESAELAWGTAPALKQWRAADVWTASLHAAGIPPGAWRVRRGEAQHFAGNSRGRLFFEMPLRGDFEVEYERSTYGWREIQVGYAAVAMDVGHTGKYVKRQPVGRSQKQINLPTKIESFGPWVKCRLIVKDGMYTTLVNGVQVDRFKLSQPADPWLYVASFQPHFHGTIRNLRITGSPKIPDELQLASGDDLTGWRSDYYQESIDTEDAAWQKRDDEIFGRLYENAKGSLRESLLQYHRPLFEDGELSYEFFYEPGKVEVHPCLDRLAFLLRPDGVRLHERTDAGWDRTHLSPENERPLPTAEAIVDKLPLKPSEWNRLRLSLSGDELTLTLNGQDITRFTLPTNSHRVFGFFRYSSETETRVRNVIFRGGWPNELPSPDDQELASPK